jgi:heterodisulfide reductase subunit B
MKKVKDPYTGYRKYMKGYCEICGKDKFYHPSELDAHHHIPQIEFKKNKEKIQHKGNIVTLCPNCHRQVELNKIKINGWRKSTVGIVLEYYYEDNPEKIIYGF